MPDRLRATRQRAVGAKQTLRALHSGNAKVVYVAGDADQRVVRPVETLARSESGTEVVIIESMSRLGRLCGIEVGAACAAILGEKTT